MELILLLLLVLIITSLGCLTPRQLEGLSCTPQKTDLVYQNTASVQQQQQNVKDFEASVTSQIGDLKNTVNNFAQLISANMNLIGINKKAIHASSQSISDAAKKKQAKLDKLSS